MIINWQNIHKILLATIGLAVIAFLLFNNPVHLVTSGSVEKRVIYMSTIEPKGGAQVEKEPFPEQKLPEGKGYKLKQPDQHGRWEASTYRFEPGLIVAYEGEEVELQIFGVNGARHQSTIEGYDLPFTVERGKVTVVKFKADKAGIFNIVCYDHLPAMQSQMLILPKKWKK